MQPINSWFPSLAVGLMVGVFAAVGAEAQDAGCKGILERMDSVPKTPNHEYVSMGPSADARAPLSETISTGTTVYVNHHGVWRNTGFTGAEMAKRVSAARKIEKATCAVLRDEALEGVPATVYRIQTDAPFGKMDSQVWFSKSTGLPLLERYEIVSSNETKSFYEIRFEYTGVTAPPGVN